MKLAITFVICSVIGCQLWNNEKAREAELENRRKVTNIAKVSARVSSTPAAINTSEHENIDSTLRLVAEQWKSTDTNGDGLYNCIDAAVLFYRHYPDKSKAGIILNRNSGTGMNHLFNCVFTDGVWKAIEPQAYANNHDSYFMRPIWGSRYDNTYNREATADYLRYVE